MKQFKSIYLNIHIIYIFWGFTYLINIKLCNQASRRMLLENPVKSTSPKRSKLTTSLL
jgi:hypothetical protein